MGGIQKGTTERQKGVYARLQDRTVSKHSVVIGGHKTSVSLEPCFWEALLRAAKSRKLTIGKLLERLGSPKNLSSAVRCHLFEEK